MSLPFANATRLTAGPSGLAIVLGLLCASLIVLTHYPGYLNPDSFTQLYQILSGHYDDWHSPTMTFIWSWFPQRGGFIAFTNVLIWGGLALIARQLMQRLGWPGLLVLLIPWLPGLFNYLGHVHKDVLFTGLLIAGFACAFQSHSVTTCPRTRQAFTLLSCLCALTAFLVRSNGIFALIPLLIYLGHRWRWQRISLFTAALLILMPVAQVGMSRALQASAEHPADTIKIYHLLGISHFQGRNLIPGQWTEEESRQIVQGCYSPVQWDTAAPWGQCSFIFKGLEEQGLWGSAELTKAWLHKVLSHPFSAYSAMAATFSLSMTTPNSPAMLYPPPYAQPIDWNYPVPLRLSTQWAQDYIDSDLNDSFSQPRWFSLAFLATAVVLLAGGVVRTPVGGLATAVLMSGAIYQLSYFPFNVSAEYRYFYWAGYAAYLSLVLSLLALWQQRVAALKHGDATCSWPLAVTMSLVIATLSALTLNTAALPMQTRTLTLQPLGDGAVGVRQFSPASTPAWMGAQRLPLESLPPGWQVEHGIYLRTVTDDPAELTFALYLSQPADTLRVRLSSGPQFGGLRIQQSDGTSHSVNTAADNTGEVIIDLPQRTTDNTRVNMAWSEARIMLILLCFAGLALLCLSYSRQQALKRSTLTQVRVGSAIGVAVVLCMLIVWAVQTRAVHQQPSILSLQPLGDGPVEVRQVSASSQPLWHSTELAALWQIPHGWHREQLRIAIGQADAAPLVLHTHGLAHTVHLRLSTGPQFGRVRLEEEGGTTRIIDTSSATPGEILIALPAPEGAPASRILPWTTPLISAALTLVITLSMLGIWRQWARRRANISA